MERFINFKCINKNMAKRNQFKPENVYRAREVANRFGDISTRCMPAETEAAIIEVWYPNIRGVKPINLVSEQRRSIAERLFNYSFGLITESDGLDKIAANIKAFEEETDPTEIDLLDERICIQMESLPDEHYLIRRYRQAKAVKKS